MIKNSLKSTFFSQLIKEKTETKPKNDESEDKKILLREKLKSTGENIRLIRKLRKMSLTELAKKAKISSKYLQAVEASSKNISIINLNRIVQALNIEITDILCYKNHEKEKNMTIIKQKLKQYNTRKLKKLSLLIINAKKMIAKD